MSQSDRSTSAREAMRKPPPPGWDFDLWFAFCSGVIYEEEVPRDADGEPLYDENGNPGRRHARGLRDGWLEEVKD